MGPQVSMTRAMAALAVWQPKPRRTMSRTRVLRPFDASVGKPESDGGQDAVAVGADGAGEFDEWRQAAALRPRAPAVEQVAGFGFGEVAGEDRP